MTIRPVSFPGGDCDERGYLLTDTGLTSTDECLEPMPYDSKWQFEKMLGCWCHAAWHVTLAPDDMQSERKASVIAETSDF